MKVEDLENYIQQVQDYIYKNHMNDKIYGWICGGDMNACHSRWGAPPPMKKDRRYEKGEQLIDWIDMNKWKVAGAGQATRWYKRKKKGYEPI